MLTLVCLSSSKVSLVVPEKQDEGFSWPWSVSLMQAEGIQGWNPPPSGLPAAILN